MTLPIPNHRLVVRHLLAKVQVFEPVKKCFRLINLRHQLRVTIAQLFPTQAHGNDIGAEFRLVARIEPAFFCQPGMQGCLGNGREHPDHGGADAGLAQETGLGFENGRVVVVEAKDHAAPHFDPCFLDAMDSLDNCAGRANILIFLGFPKGSLIGTFDADEDADDVGLHH